MNKKPIISHIKKEDLSKSKNFYLLKDLDNEIINKIDYVEFTENKGFVSVRVFFMKDKSQEKASISSLSNKETQFNKDSDATKIKG